MCVDFPEEENWKIPDYWLTKNTDSHEYWVTKKGYTLELKNESQTVIA